MELRSEVISSARDVWDGIRARPASVALSFSAIAIGMASLTFLIAVLDGLREESREIVSELGVNVVGIIQHESSGPDSGLMLQERHASILKANFPSARISNVRLHKVPTLGSNELLTVVATDSSLIDVRLWTMTDGRFLDHWDIGNRERNAVISEPLSERWNWKVGSVIMLRDIPFNVVGIVRVAGGALDSKASHSQLTLGERVVFVPKTITPFWVENQKIPTSNRIMPYRIMSAPNPLHYTNANGRLWNNPLI